VLLSQIIAVCERLWPTTGAEDWDAPGLVTGSNNQSISRALLAVDVTDAVIDQAISLGANLLIAHHPLLLKGVSTIAEDGYKGSLLAKALRANLAIFSAHTNADIVVDGVSDTFSKRLGLTNIRPLVPTSQNAGHGRIGELGEQMQLGDLVNRLENLLPSTHRGISASAAPTTPVRSVALCGGAGDAFIFDAFAAGADVYITSDLRHHVTQEAPLPVVDVSHWASESLWLETASSQLASMCSGVDFSVSDIVTDPWVFNQGRTK
jgi:dinuclear metal center YbgI/SA1388 family protein